MCLLGGGGDCSEGETEDLFQSSVTDKFAPGGLLNEDNGCSGGLLAMLVKT